MEGQEAGMEAGEGLPNPRPSFPSPPAAVLRGRDQPLLGSAVAGVPQGGAAPPGHCQGGTGALRQAPGTLY